MGRSRRIIIFIILTAVLLSGCGTSDKSRNEKMSLKFGLMPAVDSVPFLLAEKNGYFSELGLNAELQIFSNAQDRQSALQANSIDGAVTDLIAVATNVESGFDIKATTMTNGVFPVLMKEGSENKQKIKVGMMEVSVTNFLIDEWLSDKYEIEKVFINEIPARLAAIESGELDMGLFPEPVASMGELDGLVKRIYEPEAGYCPDVAVFTGKAMKEKDDAIALFHQAYNKAVEELGRDPEQARDILIERIPNVKPEIKDKIVLPEYTKASLPDTEYIRKVIDWTSDAVNKKLTVTAEDLIERKYTQQ
jgi:NitT/TauT family transport system substrate-binding protein